MSTVDKKLMDQVLRLSKGAALDATDHYGYRTQKREDTVRTIVERGMGTLPLEQRIMIKEKHQQRIEEIGRDQILRLLGTWGAMTVDAIQSEFPSVETTVYLMRYEEEGLIERRTLVSGKGVQEVVVLTEEGKRRFAAQEEALDECAADLFSALTEYEKMSLYLLLRL